MLVILCQWNYLPQITIPILKSTSQVKATTKALINKELTPEVAWRTTRISPSANWYYIISGIQKLLDFLARHTRTRLHRFRLGYHCFTDMRGTKHTCEHCNTGTDTPLIHYIKDCSRTAPYLTEHQAHALTYWNHRYYSAHCRGEQRLPHHGKTYFFHSHTPLSLYSYIPGSRAR